MGMPEIMNPNMPESRRFTKFLVPFFYRCIPKAYRPAANAPFFRKIPAGHLPFFYVLLKYQ